MQKEGQIKEKIYNKLIFKNNNSEIDKKMNKTLNFYNTSQKFTKTKYLRQIFMLSVTKI